LPSSLVLCSFFTMVLLLGCAAARLPARGL